MRCQQGLDFLANRLVVVASLVEKVRALWSRFKPLSGMENLFYSLPTVMGDHLARWAILVRFRVWVLTRKPRLDSLNKRAEETTHEFCKSTFRRLGLRC